MPKIRVLIVDDHALVREGIRMILGLHDDIEVVGEAADGLDAIDKVRSLDPDVALMDIAMPGLGGLEATLEVAKVSPRTRILVLTQHDNREYIYRFLKAGASGYILKKSVGTELVSAIRAVSKGEAFLAPSVATTVIQGYLERQVPGAEETSYQGLSDREKQVLKLIAEGHTSKEIADKLYLSIKTVMAHRSNIMEKLSVHSRTDLIKYAIKQGLISVEN